MFEETEVREATLEYFNGDELATNVFMTKYCLRDKKGQLYGEDPRRDAQASGHRVRAHGR